MILWNYDLVPLILGHTRLLTLVASDIVVEEMKRFWFAT